MLLGPGRERKQCWGLGDQDKVPTFIMWPERPFSTRISLSFHSEKRGRGGKHYQGLQIPWRGDIEKVEMKIKKNWGVLVGVSELTGSTWRTWAWRLRYRLSAIIASTLYSAARVFERGYSAPSWAYRAAHSYALPSQQLVSLYLCWWKAC
jgi:hypothetical protein